MSTPNSYDVVIVGTGLSAIAAAIKLRERGVNNFVMLEKVS